MSCHRVHYALRSQLIIIRKLLVLQVFRPDARDLPTLAIIHLTSSLCPSHLWHA